MSYWLLAILFISFLSISLIICIRIGRSLEKKKKVNTQIVPVKIKCRLGGQEVEYKILRNYQNIEIAYKIYIELITRTVALPIDEKYDVLVEIYDSWYALFQITRDELKTFSGNLLLNNEVSDDLIRLLMDILNKVLRPHLTKYQSAFRKWYNESLLEDENRSLSPQEIQVKYKEYDSLITSMISVNKDILEYISKLEKIIKG
jgi:hypothetical protein